MLLQVCVGGRWGAAAGMWGVGGVLLQVCGRYVGCCCMCVAIQICLCAFVFLLHLPVL